jgi:hypothetical protein
MKTDVESFKLLWGVDVTGYNIPEGYTHQWALAEDLAKQYPERIINAGMVKALFGIENKK